MSDVTKYEVHRLVVMVVDTDRLGADGVKQVLEEARYPNHCIGPAVAEVKSLEVEWDDDHPLNKDGWRRALGMLFDDDPPEQSDGGLRRDIEDERDAEWQRRLAPLHAGHDGDGCDSGDPIDWSLAALSNKRARDEDAHDAKVEKLMRMYDQACDGYAARGKTIKAADADIAEARAQRDRVVERVRALARRMASGMGITSHDLVAIADDAGKEPE